MQADISLITHLVIDLLKESQPDFSARLKQRLNSALVQSGFDRLNEKTYGSKRFTDFLKKHLAESLALTPPAGPGDVLVSLRDQSVAPVVGVGAPQTEAPIAVHRPVVRPDVWQAFLNQDKDRRRFLSRLDYKVLHFRNGAQSDIKAAIEGDSSSYIEISPIPEATQVEWLRSFLAKNPPSARIAASIQHLLEVDTGGVLFDAIAKILGAKDGDIWRSQRVNHIYSHIVSWCDQNDINPSVISQLPKEQSESVPVASSGESPTGARKQAHAILDSMSDADIAQFVLPILALTVLVKARI